MSRFTAAQYDLTGQTKNGRPVVCLTTPLVYEVGFLGSGWTLEARAGFCTDLASVPPIPRPLARMLAKTRRTRRWLRRLIRWRRWVIRRIGRSAIVHDLMRDDRRWDKLLGDYVFYEAMGVDGVPNALRVAAFAAVLANFNRD